MAPELYRRSSNPLYVAWKNMRQRCFNPGNPRYDRYGARGITVCARWESFELFVSDMGVKPFATAQIDRINNDGDYSPENCRWASPTENIRNSASTKITPAMAEQIKTAFATQGGSNRGISAALEKELGVAAATLRDISYGRTWATENHGA